MGCDVVDSTGDAGVLEVFISFAAGDGVIAAMVNNQNGSGVTANGRNLVQSADICLGSLRRKRRRWILGFHEGSKATDRPDVVANREVKSSNAVR